MSIRFNLAIIATLSLSACASIAAPTPEEVCTVNWIKPRAERALGQIRGDTDDVIASMRKVAASYVEGKKPGPLQLLSLAGSLKSLETELKNGRGMQDLKTLARTCDDPVIITKAMGEFMRGQGLPNGLVNFIEGLDSYQKILLDAMRDISR